MQGLITGKPGVFDDFIEYYGPRGGEDAPIRFARDVLGITCDPWQEDVLRAYQNEERRISIRACHGPGKTFIVSIMVCHQSITRFPQHCVATAPTRRQLEKALLKEVKLRFETLPELLRQFYKVRSSDILFTPAPEDSFFAASTARPENPEALQGIHCDAGWVLLIADEASGVHEKIFESARGSMSGKRATTVLLSNPTRTSGLFFDSHHSQKIRWKTFHIGAHNSERVDPDFIEDIKLSYGEQSDVYRVRVLGEFPRTDTNTVIPYELADSAVGRDIELDPKRSYIWGLHVARYGNNATALVKRSELDVVEVIQWHTIDVREIVEYITEEWNNTSLDYRPANIVVGAAGFGAQVAQKLREMGIPARTLNVDELTSLDSRYKDKRTQLWLAGRDWFYQRDKVLPTCDDECHDNPFCVHKQLVAQLSLVQYTFGGDGKMQVETLSQIEKRGVTSPDTAEAFVLSLADVPARATNTFRPLPTETFQRGLNNVV